jgi:hypothetical protein
MINLVSEERAQLAGARTEGEALACYSLASIESGLTNAIGEREVFLFHRPEWGGVWLIA